jgi:hypothetical protein
MALENPLVQAAAGVATEYPHLVQKYGAMGVSRTVIHEDRAIEGAVPEPVLLQKILEALGTQARI